MSEVDVDSIAQDIAALSPPERFRLVAMLLEARQAKLALAVARRATSELAVALLLNEDNRQFPAVSEETEP